ncbi:MAG: AcsA protein [Nitrospira sp.]|jgi:siderophore synthetase component|nr:AcsA protein [Nitrospira sp.]
MFGMRIAPADDAKPGQVDSQAEAEATVLVDLVNALLTENLFNLAARLTMQTSVKPHKGKDACDPALGETFASVQAARSAWTIVFPASLWTGGSCRMTRGPLFYFDHPESPVEESLGPLELMQLLMEDIPDRERMALRGLPMFLEDLRLALRHASLALDAASCVVRTFCSIMVPHLRDWERLAALRDRPFHPTARARRGWDDETYRRYSPEYGRTVTLEWVAVHKEWVHQSLEAGLTTPAALLLSHADQVHLNHILVADKLKTHIPIPVHPWQMVHGLRHQFAKEIKADIVRVLDAPLGEFIPTSSIRTLAPVAGNGYHVKLPLAIGSLGALRILPPHYLHNGEQAQSYLEMILQRDTRLSQRLLLCNERRWWSYLPPGKGLTNPEAGHLGCLIRDYPIIPACHATVLPLSALTVQTQDQQVPALVALIGPGCSLHRVLQFFSDVVTIVSEVAFVCLEYGVMPELHGQNVLLVHEPGGRLRLLLRDHDTLRMYPQAVEQSGMPVLRYLLRPGHNTLITASREELLSYFQTLAVQVMLASIGKTLAQTYHPEEFSFWRIIREGIERAHASLALSWELRKLLRTQVLESETWPSKLILSPLFQHPACEGPGMPSAQGITANPLRDINGRKRETRR